MPFTRAPPTVLTRMPKADAAIQRPHARLLDGFVDTRSDDIKGHWRSFQIIRNWVCFTLFVFYRLQKRTLHLRSRLERFATTTHIKFNHELNGVHDSLLTCVI